MAIENPFRTRQTEQHRDNVSFLRSFGSEMLEALPPKETAWDRPIVLRSAPGSGKTSLLRMLTPDSLTALMDRRYDTDERYRALRVPLVERGVLEGDDIRILGVLISVGTDYRTLVDLGPGGHGNQKVFFKLLDWRLMTKALEAILVASGLTFPADAGAIELEFAADRNGQAAKTAFAQLCEADLEINPLTDGAESVNGAALLGLAGRQERSVLRLLDSLLPVEWSQHGHSRMYALPFLGGVHINVNGKRKLLRPTLLLDDVHQLAADQRAALFEQLLDRTLLIGRWIAEQPIAASEREILQASKSGRDYVLIQIDEELGGKSSRMGAMLASIAESRARTPLSQLNTSETFINLLPGADHLLMSRKQDAAELSAMRFAAFCDENPKYQPWLRDAREQARGADPLESAIRYRELEILALRDLNRSEPTLFDLPEAGDVERLASKDTSAAARLLVSIELGTPYYAGADTLTDLASRNVEQYLGLAGDLFDLVIAAAKLSRPNLALPPDEQDRRVRRSSRELWDSVSRRVPYGADVLALLHIIASRSRSETLRPTAPYAPGVTGLAYERYEGDRIFAPDGSLSRPMERLARALKSAVAFNLIELRQSSSKGHDYTVMYLNRLLNPHFNLPLRRGSYRETQLTRLAQQLEVLADRQSDLSAPDPEEIVFPKEGW